VTKIVRMGMKKRARKVFSLFFWTPATFFWFMFGRRFAQMEQICQFWTRLEIQKIFTPSTIPFRGLETKAWSFPAMRDLRWARILYKTFKLS